MSVGGVKVGEPAAARTPAPTLGAPAIGAPGSLNPAVDAGRETARSSSRFADYMELTKPRITFLVLVTTFIGFFMGARGAMDLPLLFHTLFGTALVAGGASALNQVLEHALDARMKRTRNRPLPARRLSVHEAQLFGVTLCAVGVLYLTFAANLLTGALAAATVASYVFLYTPLKTVTPLSTMIGAVPGALPPVGGWAAATNQVTPGAWILFGIVFAWQLPHFLAIAWIYRDDYDRAGYPMLPVLDRVGLATGRHMVVWSLALIPISLMPTLLFMTGTLYFFGALLLGLVFLAYSVLFTIFRTDRCARHLFLVSILYLPLLWGLMILDKSTL